MSRFKSLKEMSTKKKIFICLLVIAVVVAVVFVVIKFAFPDVDTTRPYTFAYEVGADSTSKKQLETALNFFESNGDDEQKAQSKALSDINTFYMARLSVNKTTNHNLDRLLFSLSEVQDMNKLNKKIKKLESLKENVDDAKSDAVSYCENQIMPYKESTTNYSRISDYFSTFAKKMTNYLKSMRDFENYLAEIINTSTTESIYSNDLTKFTTSLNNRRLSLCVDACEKKFINGEDVAISSPNFSTSISSDTTMFEQKDEALANFVKNKDETIQKINTINGYEWLDSWLVALGTDGEQTFVETLDETIYNEFKTFMQGNFTVTMTDYPEKEDDTTSEGATSEGATSEKGEER